MALIPCPGCSRQVSDKAIACPGCGYRIAKQESREAKKSRSRVEQKHESLVTLLAESARNVTEKTSVEDLKEFAASRAEGLFQVVVATVLCFISLYFFWPFAIIAGIYALRGIYVVFTGDKSQLSR
jgi:DNA-directed RNA polymerase subunit RPC12/RpoP